MTDSSANGVLIVGAGPTGLSLAIALRRHGIPVRIVDRAAAPRPVSPALVIWSASLEVLQGLGVIEPSTAEGQRLKALCVGAGERRIATLPVGEGIDSPFPFPLLLPQSRIEALLTARLAGLGVAVERSVALTGLVQDEGGVSATLCQGDGHSETVRTAYLAGCDGADSVVRQTLGVAFEGDSEPQTFLLADLKIEGSALDPRCIHLWWRDSGTVALFPVGDGIWRVFSMRPPDAGIAGDAPTTFEEMQACVAAYGPRGLKLHSPSWLSTFRIDERLAARYRVGRCFLVGDAAHVHSPVGGQGMNTGLQDAVNLGWKLAYALRGIGYAEHLLDSYEAERRPVGRAVIDAAAHKQHIAFGPNRFARFARNTAVSIAGSIPSMQRRLQVDLSETGIAYRGGQRTDVGSRARDARLIDASGAPTSLWPLLSKPCHSLLVFEEGERPAELPPLGKAGDRLQVLRLDGRADPRREARERYRLKGPGWVLVRPDHVVAARGEGTDFGALKTYIADMLSERTR